MADLNELKYTAEHEWILIDGDVATVGITDYAAEKLGDVVFVELPKVGSTLDRGHGRRRDRVDQVGRRALRARQRDVVEVNEAVADEPRARQQRPVRRRLARQGAVHRAARAARPATRTRH